MQNCRKSATLTLI